jgi:serine/threonine protein kinase
MLLVLLHRHTEGSSGAVASCLLWSALHTIVAVLCAQLTEGHTLPGCSYARGILAGLCELHSARIAMLDVKPGNVLLADDGSPVLTDFGISRELREATRFQTSSTHGTPVYMAPEQFDSRAAVGRPADLWGWAATLVHMLAGEAPFATEPLHSISGLVLRDKQHPEVPLEALAAPGLEQLLLDCFQFEAGQRPTAEEALCRLDGIMHQVGGCRGGASSVKKKHNNDTNTQCM